MSTQEWCCLGCGTRELRQGEQLNRKFCSGDCYHKFRAGKRCGEWVAIRCRNPKCQRAMQRICAVVHNGTSPHEKLGAIEAVVDDWVFQPDVLREELPHGYDERDTEIERLRNILIDSTVAAYAKEKGLRWP